MSVIVWGDGGLRRYLNFLKDVLTLTLYTPLDTSKILTFHLLGDSTKMM
jgi:hypothetical protein